MGKRTWYLPVSDTEKAYIDSDLDSAKEVRAGHNVKIEPSYYEGAFDLQKDDFDKMRVETETRNILAQFGKGVINSTENMLAAFGRSAIEGVANFANLSVSLQTPLVNPVIRGVKGEGLDLGENLSADIQASFKSIIDNNKKIQGHLLAMKQSNDAMLEQLGLARDKKDGFFFDVGQIPAQLGLSFILKDPKMVGMVFGILARRQNIEEEQEKGNENAENVGALSGLTTGLVNGIGFHFFTKALKTRYFDKVVAARVAPFIRAALGTAEEATEEVIDELQESAIMNTLGSRNDSLGTVLKNSAYAGLLGAVGGAPFAGAGAYYYNRQINDVHSILQKENPKATKEDAKKVVDAAMSTISDKKVQEDIADIVKNQNSIVSYRNGQVTDALKAAQEALDSDNSSTLSEDGTIPTDTGPESVLLETQKSALVEDMQTDDNMIFEKSATYTVENSADIAGADLSDEAQVTDAVKQYQKKGTDSPYFQKWFGDSKVIDKSGKPLVVYHGTSKEFDTFDKNKSVRDELGKGFYFSSAESTAREFGKNMVAVYLSLQNPFVIEEQNKKNIADLYKEYAKEQIYTNIPDKERALKKYIEYEQGGNFAEETILETLLPLLQGDEFSNFLKNKGYDGIISESLRLSQFDGNIYVVFEPNQIKSVNNQGTFDEDNQNIFKENKIAYSAGMRQGFLESLTRREDGPEISKDLNNIQPFEIKGKVPEFTTTKELLQYISTELNVIGEIDVKETGQKISVSRSGIKRSLKRKRDKNTMQVFSEFKKLFENAKYAGFIKAKEGRNVQGQDVFVTFMKLNGQIYEIEFRVDVPISESKNNRLYYAGHKIKALASDTDIIPLLNESNNIVEERLNFVKNNKLENAQKIASEQLELFENNSKEAVSLNNIKQYGDGSFTAFETKVYNMPNYTLLGDSLSGTPKITTPDEVAFLFRNLEQAGTENAFAVMVFEGGRYEVLYISCGTSNSASIPIRNVMSAVAEKQPKQLYFIHNHPGGVLKASDNDINVLRLMQRTINTVSPETKLMPGIIIDLDSGQYGLFNEDTTMWSRDRIDFSSDYKPDVYQFGKMAYYQKSDDVLTSPDDVAKFLSKQKRGIGSKMQVVFIDNGNRIQKYVILPDYIFDKEGNLIIGKTIESIVNASVGTNGNFILSGNANISKDDLKQINAALSPFNVSVTDYVLYKENEEIIDNYFSYLENGADFKALKNSQIVMEDEAEYRVISAQRFEKILNSDNEQKIINYFTKRFIDIVLAADGRTYDESLQNNIDSFKNYYGINKSSPQMKAVAAVGADYVRFLQGEALGAGKDIVFERMNNFIINLFARAKDMNLKMSKTAEAVYKYALKGRAKDVLNEEEISQLIGDVKKKEASLEKKSVKSAIDVLRTARLRTPKKPKPALLNDIKKLAKDKGITLPKDLGTFDFASIFDVEKDLYQMMRDNYSRYFVTEDENGTNEAHGQTALELVEKAVRGEDIYTDSQQIIVDRINEIEQAKEAAKSWFNQAALSENEFLDVIYALYDDAGGVYDAALIEEISKVVDNLAVKSDDISTDERKQINEILKNVKAKDREAVKAAKNRNEMINLLEDVRRKALENIINEQEAQIDKSKLTPPERQDINAWIARAADAAIQGLKEDNLTAFKNDLKKAVNRQKHLSAYHKQLLLVRIEAMKAAKDFVKESERLVEDLYRYESEGYKKYIDGKIDSIASLAWKIKSGKWAKGKYLAEDNEYFAEIEQISKMSKEEASHYLEQLEVSNAQRNYDEHPMSEKDKLLLQYLFVKANDVTDNELLKSLFDKMQLLRNAASENMAISQMLGDMRHEEAVNEIVDSLKERQFNKIWAKFVGFVGNMETLSNYIFGKKAAQNVKTLENALRAANISASIRRENALKRIAAVYGLKNTDTMIDKWLVNEKEKFDFIKTFNGVETTQELSRNNLIYIYTQLLNTAQRERYLKLYGPVQLQRMVEILTEQDKASALEFVNLIEENFDTLNKAYVELRGFGIPRMENYFPSTGMSASTELDLLSELRTSANIANQSFTQKRVKIADMPLSDPFKVLYKNINAAEAVIHAGQELIEMNKIIKDAKVRNAISDKKINKDGIAESLYKALRATIDYVVLEINGGLETVSDGSLAWFDKMTSNLAVAAIGLKPIIAIKQMASFVNYAEEMPVEDFIKYGTEFWENPVENFQYVFQNDYYRLRYKNSSFNEILQSSMTTLDQKAISLKNFATFFIRAGDALANCYGSWIYIQYLKSEGKSEQEAFNMAIDKTENSQQSSLAITQANFQNAAKKSHASVLTAFTNTSNQYLRKVVNAVIDYNNGVIKGDDLAKKIGLYVFINGWIYGLLTYGLKAVFADDDDDRESALRSVAMSPLDTLGGFLPIVGEYVGYILNALIDKAVTGKVHESAPNPFSLITDFIERIGNLKKALDGKADSEDLAEFIGIITIMFAGIDTKILKNIAGGVEDLFRGEVIKGAARLTGYTRNYAEKTFGEKKKKGMFKSQRSKK